MSSSGLILTTPSGTLFRLEVSVKIRVPMTPRRSEMGRLRLPAVSRCQAQVGVPPEADQVSRKRRFQVSGFRLSVGGADNSGPAGGFKFIVAKPSWH